MSSKQSFLGTVAAMGIVFTIAGCGSGDGTAFTASNVTMQQTTTGNPQQATAADGFISRIMAIISTRSDTAEPVDIQSITVSTPEDAEPVPIS